MIKPELYKELKRDQDLIVSCLEVIRLNLPPIIPESSPDIEYDLITVDNPFGPPYPAIILYEPYLQIKIDWVEKNERVAQWLQQTGLHTIINKAANSYYINRGKLFLLKAFPP